MRTRDFTVDTARGPLACTLASPAPEHAVSDPALLLAFAGARHSVLGDGARFLPAIHFVEKGHEVLSFDLPNHGDRIDAHGEGISGMCAAFTAGDDPFVRFVDDGTAVIDACLERRLAHSERIFVCGVSRGGYCALRLGAADRRIRGMAALAPVTDWRMLSEFSQVKERSDVAALRLESRAQDLAGRPVYVVIGNRDHRVGTHSCARFASRLFELEQPSLEAESVQVHVVEAPGHTVPDEWAIEGARFLLKL